MSEHSDGTGYWVRLWQIGTPPQHGFDIMAGDNHRVTESLYTFPTREAALAAAKRVIAAYRAA